MSTYIDTHTIQNLPPSYVDRDDSSSPKSVVYSGVHRLWAFSRSWKRTTRLYSDDLLGVDNIGVCTKRVAEVSAEAIMEDAPEFMKNTAVPAEGVFKAVRIEVSPPRGKEDGAPESEYLLFLFTSQIVYLAGLAIASACSGEVLDVKTVKEVLKEEYAVDIAFSG